MRIWFYKKINKIDKPLSRLTRGHRDSILINKIRNEKGIKQQILKKSKTPSDPSTKGYSQQNWKT
jgi:CRISPR/Cas system-associated endoribonuclease Cas2